MKKFSFIILAFVSLLFVSCDKLIDTTIEEVEATITEKSYVPPQHYTYTTFISSGKTLIPIILNGVHPAKYNVSYKYDYYSNIENNQTIYLNYNVGDKIACTLTRKEYESRKGNYYRWYLESK